MTAKYPLADQQIMDCLSAHYGIQATVLTSLPLGADMDASVYKAKAHDQSSYFIKIKQGSFQDISVTVQMLLQEAGIEQVIPPLKTIHGHATHRMNGFTLIVYPFVKGQDGFTHHLTLSQWPVLGKVLRQIHELDIPPSIQGQVRHEGYSPKWREAVRSFYVHPKTGPTDDVIAQKFRAFMEERAATIHRLVDQSEQLAWGLQGQYHPFVLCHSDLHGGNVLISGDGSVYIVDWDDPIMAPKERDLMFIGGGVGNTWNKPHETKAFFQGYGATKINRDLLAYYRYERIVEDIAFYSQQLLAPSTDHQGRLKAYEHFIAQFYPNGVVEIAFKTEDPLA